MGNNYVKQLGIKPSCTIGTKEFNLIWAKYAERDDTMRKKNALKFLKDFAVAVNVKCDDALIDKLITDAGLQNATMLSKDAFLNLFFVNAETTGHAALTQSVMAYRRRGGGSNSGLFQSIDEKDLSKSMDKIDKPEQKTTTTIITTTTTTAVTTCPSSHTLSSNSQVIASIESLFSCYAEEGEDFIGPHGLIKFLNDLGIAPNDIALLVLAFHMGANSISIFTKAEFMQGLIKLNLNTIDAIKEAVPQLRATLEDEEKFMNIYKFAHQFYKENPKHKTIPVDVADSVLEMLVNHRPHIVTFRKFLLKQKEYKGINIDQWINILDFTKSVTSDLENFMESSSWPYLIDMYVEWVKEGHTGDSEEEKKEEKTKKEGEFEFEI